MKLICDKLNCMYLYTKHKYSNVKTTVKKKLYCEILLQLKMTVFCLNIFQNIIYTCDKVEFSVSIDTWFFRIFFLMC